MLVIDFRNEQRHIVVHPERRRVADYRVTGSSKTALCVTRDVAREGRKNQIAGERWRGCLYRKGANVLRHFTLQTPRTRFAICLSLRSIRGSDCSYFKLRMILQQLNKPLAHHARGAENTDSKLPTHDFQPLLSTDYTD
jgi:hypothetical protein